MKCIHRHVTDAQESLTAQQRRAAAILASVAAALLAMGALHLIGVLPPG